MLFCDISSLRKLGSWSALRRLQAIDLEAVVLEVVVSHGFGYDNALGKKEGTISKRQSWDSKGDVGSKAYSIASCDSC